MQLMRGRSNQRGLMGLGTIVASNNTNAPMIVPTFICGAPHVGAVLQPGESIDCQGGPPWITTKIAPTPVVQAPTANISVNVPTNVNTTVSPQISPNMQQSSGSGSLTAGTAQSGPSSGLTANDVQKLIDQQSAVMQAQYAAQLQAQQAANAAIQAAQQAAQAAPVSAPVAPALTMAVAPDTTAAMPVASPQPEYSSTMILLTLAGVVAAYMSLDKGKSK